MVWCQVDDKTLFTVAMRHAENRGITSSTKMRAQVTAQMIATFFASTMFATYIARRTVHRAMSKISVTIKHWFFGVGGGATGKYE